MPFIKLLPRERVAGWARQAELLPIHAWPWAWYTGHPAEREEQRSGGSSFLKDTGA